MRKLLQLMSEPTESGLRRAIRFDVAPEGWFTVADIAEATTAMEALRMISGGCDAVLCHAEMPGSELMLPGGQQIVRPSDSVTIEDLAMLAEQDAARLKREATEPRTLMLRDITISARTMREIIALRRPLVNSPIPRFVSEPTQVSFVMGVVWLTEWRDPSDSVDRFTVEVTKEWPGTRDSPPESESEQMWSGGDIREAVYQLMCCVYMEMLGTARLEYVDEASGTEETEAHA